MVMRASGAGLVVLKARDEREAGRVDALRRMGDNRNDMVGL